MHEKQWSRIRPRVDLPFGDTAAATDGAETAELGVAGFDKLGGPIGPRLRAVGHLDSSLVAAHAPEAVPPNGGSWAIHGERSRGREAHRYGNPGCASTCAPRLGPQGEPCMGTPCGTHTPGRTVWWRQGSGNRDTKPSRPPTRSGLVGVRHTLRNYLTGNICESTSGMVVAGCGAVLIAPGPHHLGAAADMIL